MMKSITQDQLQDEVRNAVLAALDQYARDLLGHDKARGWTDQELPKLFAGVDAQAKALAARINEGAEPGSATVTVIASSPTV